MPPPDTLFPYQPLLPLVQPAKDTAVSTWVFRQHLPYLNDRAGETDFHANMLFLLLLALILAVPMIRKWTLRRQEERDTDVLFKKRGLQYHEWLRHHNQYYNSLSAKSQVIFLRRVIQFRRSKKFHYHLEFENYIPVFISAAAVQITFGLKNFKLQSFSDIHVLSGEYYLGQRSEPYIGHVKRGSIFLAWNHFLYGYTDYADARNLGLHEMAHALTYEVFREQADDTDEFKSRFTAFVRAAKPYYSALRLGEDLLLDNYAATNFDEFWAVSIETFFENPVAYREAMPEVYEKLCLLLNQDPLAFDKLINPARV